MSANEPFFICVSVVTYINAANTVDMPKNTTGRASTSAIGTVDLNSPGSLFFVYMTIFPKGKCTPFRCFVVFGENSLRQQEKQNSGLKIFDFQTYHFFWFLSIAVQYMWGLSKVCQAAILLFLIIWNMKP